MSYHAAALPTVHWPEAYVDIIRTAHLNPLQALHALRGLQSLRALRGEGLSPARWFSAASTLSNLALYRGGGAWESCDQNHEMARMCAELSLSPLPQAAAPESAQLAEDGLKTRNPKLHLMELALVLDPKTALAAVRRSDLNRAERKTLLHNAVIAAGIRRPDLTLDGTLERRFIPAKLEPAIYLKLIINALDTRPLLSESFSQALLNRAWQSPPDQQALLSEYAPQHTRKNPAQPHMTAIQQALKITAHAALQLSPQARADVIPRWLWEMRTHSQDSRALWQTLIPGRYTTGTDHVTQLWFSSTDSDPLDLTHPRKLAAQISQGNRLMARLHPAPGGNLALQDTALGRPLPHDIVSTLLREGNSRQINPQLRCQRLWQLPALTHWLSRAVHDPELNKLRQQLSDLAFSSVRQLALTLYRNELAAQGYPPESKQPHPEIMQATISAISPLAELSLRWTAQRLTEARQDMASGTFNDDAPSFSLPEMLMAQHWEYDPVTAADDLNRADLLRGILTTTFHSKELQDE